MNERIEKIKEHFKKHKVAYSCAGTGVVVVGITCIIMRSNGSFCGRLYDQRCEADVYTTKSQMNIASFTSSKNNTLQQTISIYGNRIGRPGNPIVDTETGKRFESESLAAASVGVSPTSMWRHLKGEYPNLAGHVFKRIGSQE